MRYHTPVAGRDQSHLWEALEGVPGARLLYHVPHRHSGSLQSSRSWADMAVERLHAHPNLLRDAEKLGHILGDIVLARLVVCWSSLLCLLPVHAVRSTAFAPFVAFSSDVPTKVEL